MLPKYWYTFATKESVEYVNKEFSQSWEFPGYGTHIGFDGNKSNNGTDKFYNPLNFLNNSTYLTQEQFIEAMKKEFKRGDIIIDDDGDHVEFIADLGEKDNTDHRYVVKYEGDYYFSESVTKKKEQTEIKKAIELLTREGKIVDGKVLI